MTLTLTQTPLHAWHMAQGAKMAEFGGWSMPIQYGSIVSEHVATRSSVGLFDISHMGRLIFRGSAAGAFLDRLLSRPVSNLTGGRVRYALLTNHEGGTVDDVLVTHLRDATGPFFLMVVNAGNLQKVLVWLDACQKEFSLNQADLEWEDKTHQQSMFAVQGPRSEEVVRSVCASDINKMGYYTAELTTFDSHQGVLSRTGYTGEDGWELIVPAIAAEALWEKLFACCEQIGGTSIGLAARDTLRLEAAMPLYGHELSEKISPLQAGLEFAVHLTEHDFVGRDALLRLAEQANFPRRIGLIGQGRRVPRDGYPIRVGTRQIGSVSSGTHSPTLGRPIAMGFVEQEFASVGTEVSIDMRGREEAAEVVALPFYKRLVT